MNLGSKDAGWRRAIDGVCVSATEELIMTASDIKYCCADLWSRCLGWLSLPSLDGWRRKESEVDWSLMSFIGGLQMAFKKLILLCAARWHGFTRIGCGA